MSPHCKPPIESFMEDGALRGRIKGTEVAYFFKNFRGSRNLDEYYDHIKATLRAQNSGGMLILSNADTQYKNSDVQPWLSINTRLVDLEDLCAAETLGLDTSDIFQVFTSFTAEMEIDKKINSLIISKCNE